MFLNRRRHLNEILRIHGLVVGDLFAEMDEGLDVFARNNFLVVVEGGIEVVDEALLTL